MMVAMYVKDIYLMILLSNLFWVIDSQLAAFKQLQEVDNEMSSFSKYLIDAIKHQQTGIEDIQKEALKNIVVSGSTQEGAMTTRVFKPAKTKDGINRELEADLEYKLMEIPASYKNFIEDIPEKKGFVKIRMNKDVLHLVSSKIGWKVDSKEYEEILSKVSKNGYLKPYRFKEEVLKKVKIRNRDNEIKLILSVALNIEIDRITLSHPLEEVTKSSVGSYVDIIIDNEVKLKVSWDVVAVIQLNWWPNVATEWIERERKWPSKDTITDLTRISYITQSSYGGKLIKDTFELRYSFAHIERALISERSSHQAFVYLVFKSMIYKWVKPIDSDQIHSFIAKTVMLWTCEKYPPNHPLWNETSTVPALTFLFNELLKSVKENNLPYYFIPTINVLGNIKGDLRGKMIHQIKEMLLNIKQFIPDNVNEVTIACQEMLNMVKATYKVMDDVRNEYYDIFLKRPDLIPIALEIYGSHLLNLGSNKKEELSKQFDDVKDTLSEKWNQFQEDINMEEVKKNVKEKLNQVKDHLNLNDLEKKAKDFFKKFEL